MSSWLSHTLFTLSALAGVASALLVVTRRNPIYSALFLVIFFITMALDFLLLDATFLAFMQLLVYAGAIMVLYLFVIMLINPREGDLPSEGSYIDKGVAAGVSLITFLLLAAGIQRSEKLQGPPIVIPSLPPVSAGHGDVGPFGLELFSQHLLVFEMTSVLILIAIVGAVHLSLQARRTRIAPRPSVLESPESPETPETREEEPVRV